MQYHENETPRSSASDYSRRRFIAKAASIPLVTLLAPSFVKALAAGSSPVRTLMTPMAAVTLGKTALDIIASFSGSKDSSIAAMMRYQNAVLHEIIGSLQNITQSLVNVQNAVTQLPEEFRKIMAEQFRTELIAKINGAALRYISSVLVPSQPNPDLIRTPQMQKEIENIVFGLDQDISTLFSLQNSFGPESCMIAPLAMSINIAGRTSLDHGRTVLVGQLMKYKQWFDDMLSDKPGAIKSQLEKAMRNHDALIDSLAKNPLAQRLEMSNFKLAGTQKGVENTDPAVLVSSHSLISCQTIEGRPCDAQGGYVPLVGMLKAPYGTYVRLAEVKAIEDKTLGALLLTYTQSEPKAYSRKFPDSMVGYQPLVGKYHHLHVVPANASMTPEYIKNVVESDQTAARNNNPMRAEIQMVIAQANLERANIVFCTQANLVAFNTQKRIQEYLTAL